MALHIPAKVLIHVWSYNFYDMTLSTGKQQHNMIQELRGGRYRTCIVQNN